MKKRPVASEFHEDRRPDITKLFFAVRNFANEPKKINLLIMTRVIKCSDLWGGKCNV
jgi:hypothetical protein